VGQSLTPEMPRFLGWSVGRHWLLPQGASSRS